MRGLPLVAAAGLLAYAAWRAREGGALQGIESVEDAAEAVADLGADVLTRAGNALQLWRAPAHLAPLIRAAEARHGIPPTMLERLLWQESRYRADIIEGRTKSPAGALGIAQFMPATAAGRGVDPLNVPQAIDGAGAYLAELFRRFGTWSQALAAYNWGQGNVSRKGLQAAPRETRRYYTEILADVNATAGTNYA